MGLLDDAIREHLDLKRQHGADAGEVARQEQEALGPVRREPAAAADAAPVDDAAPTELHAAAEPEPGDGEPTIADLRAPAEPGLAAPEPPPAEDLDVPARGPGGTVARPLAETEEWGFEDEGDEGEEGDPEEEPEAAGEDVLEQTPEFLSETPEHDRLWFEQKPPRPFDFDG